jgi:hypothetical protein
MEPIYFDKYNKVLKGPEGTGDLPVWVGKEGIHDANKEKIGETQVIISCWQLSEAEIMEIRKTGKVWLHLYGLAHPPVTIEARNPFNT